MKNTVKFMLVAVAMVTVLACGGAKKEEAAQDTTKVETPAPAADTTAAPADTTASAPAAAAPAN